MTYPEALDFLYYQLPVYQREGKAAYKVDLSNIIALCDYLGNPHKTLQCIHVGGTNGKGSVSKLLSSVCMENNLKTGLYTSPHYIDFRERIQINGSYIPEESVIEFLEKIMPVMESISPSFFEITVAMAFWYFQQESVDIAVIEVGLGGRLDSTNIVSPLLSVITNIGLDHQQFLGDTLELIAIEKAGIIKPNTPVVIGEFSEETGRVFEEKAASQLSPIYFANQRYQIQFGNEHTIELIDGNTTLTIADCPIYADYQLKNISTAYGAFTVLKNLLHFEDEHFILGLQNINQNAPMLGRYQIIGKQPLTILDSAHNAEGVGALLHQIKSHKYNELHIIYACVNDKDVAQICKLLPPNARYYLTQPNIPRKMPVHQLSNHFAHAALEHMLFLDPKEALKSAKHYANPKDIILAFGSIFLIADLL